MHLPVLFDKSLGDSYFVSSGVIRHLSPFSNQILSGFSEVDSNGILLTTRNGSNHWKLSLTTHQETEALLIGMVQQRTLDIPNQLTKL